jgi:hypothetical protein
MPPAPPAAHVEGPGGEKVEPFMHVGVPLPPLICTEMLA